MDFSYMNARCEEERNPDLPETWKKYRVRLKRLDSPSNFKKKTRALIRKKVYASSFVSISIAPLLYTGAEFYCTTFADRKYFENANELEFMYLRLEFRKI
jgi:hypothetical protein